MELCGIPRIDDLMAATPTAKPIQKGDPDAQTVGVVQQMLTGLGLGGLPNMLKSDFGVFGPATTAAVQSFRAQCGLPAGGAIDSACLQAMATANATSAILSRGYMTLVLDFEYSGLGKILSVTAQMEGAGKFGALNLNTDKAGLSFGLIQWAQKPGRLAELLQAFQTASTADFVRILGDGDAGVASGLLAHTRLPHGGADGNGVTVNPAYDLVHDPWVIRFRQAAQFKLFQQVQVKTALNDFASSQKFLQAYAPQFTTERAVGFMLDVANQFGDTGARGLYKVVTKPGMTVPQLLQAVADESVARIHDPFKAGTQARREHFLTTSFLSDGPFQ